MAKMVATIWYWPGKDDSREKCMGSSDLYVSVDNPIDLWVNLKKLAETHGEVGLTLALDEVMDKPKYED